MRLFFAVEFADAIKSEIQRAIDALAIPNPPWRWVATSNLHVTLKFLGKTVEDRVEPLCESAESACRTIDPFAIRLGSLGAFPSLARPRVLFFKIEEGAAPLRHLAESLDAALSQDLGLSPETRPFQSHATIARVKRALRPATVACLEAAPPLADARQTVDTVTLFQSELRPKGPLYHRLKGFALAKSKC
ncbi:MAG: RNA 2',3'-cyclic phosphodiesterase [Candidatus Krumholzibacteria bacterium]